MIESSDRVEQFKAEIADMHIKDPAAGRDAQLLRGGAVVMLAGIVVTIVAYFMSHNTSNPLTQNDAQTIGMIGIAVRRWRRRLSPVFTRPVPAVLAARLIYEQQAQTDRILGSARPSSVGSDV